MTERKFQDAAAHQIEQTFTSQNTKNLFREIELPSIVSKSPVQRTEMIVDVVLHSSIPLKGIKYQRQYNPNDEFSLDIVRISKGRENGGIIGFALEVQGFDLINAKNDSDNFYLYRREQHTKPWAGALPLWESQSSFNSES